MEWITAEERAQRMGQEPYALAHNEVVQAATTGRDVTALRRRLADLDPDDHDELLAVYQAALDAPRTGERTFESSQWDRIHTSLPVPREDRQADEARLADQLRGAWTGRVIGNMMGKPVEKGFDRAGLRRHLESENAYPLRDYIPLSDEQHARAHGFHAVKGLTRGRIDGGVRDDDIDFTVLGLLMLENYGAGLRTADIAYEWLRRFPVYQLYTAERAAYQNLIREIPLTEVGSHHNPYREWIGAQIRADIHGYTHPGHPRAAAQAAYTDAWLSHRANGIYAAMWAGALIASAFTTEGALESVHTALEHIPPDCRLAAEIRLVVSQYRAGWSWEDCLDAIEARHAELSWVHAVNNTGALVAALLWGEGDFAATVGLAVQSGLDTDSIGATAGSWAGARLGYRSLPGHLVAPLHDRTSTAVFGAGEVILSDLAERTRAVIRAIASSDNKEG